MSPSLVVMISLTRSTVQFYMLTRTLADMVHSLLLPHLLTDNDDTERQDFFFPFPFSLSFLVFRFAFHRLLDDDDDDVTGREKRQREKDPRPSRHVGSCRPKMKMTDSLELGITGEWGCAQTTP